MREEALAYLAAHNVMTLATASTWAAAVFYANEDFTLYFVSSPGSRHAVDIAQRPSVAAAIHEDYRDWRKIRGIQLSATAHALTAAEREAALACYFRKFAFLEREASLRQALERAACYRLVPSELHWIDNAAGFGRRTRVL